MNTIAPAMRERCLRALDVEPLRLRVRNPVAANATRSASPEAPEAVGASLRASDALQDDPSATGTIRRLALQPDPAELDDPAIRKMYEALTEAVGKAGLQRVRPCDVADDPTAAVMVFGAAPLPEGVPAQRVLHVEALGVLHADRERKRSLWARMQALGRIIEGG
ncbi:MAG: hypothetical protein ACREPK_03800 [Rhodanobacteraceae bacterium]